MKVVASGKNLKKQPNPITKIILYPKKEKKYNQETFMKKQKTIFCGHQQALVFMHLMG